MASEARRHPLPWYLRPVPTVSAFGAAVLVSWLLVDDERFRRLTGSVKVHDPEGAAFYVACFLAFALGAAVAGAFPRPTSRPDGPAPSSTWKGVGVAAWLVAGAAHAVWVGIALSRAGGVAPLVARLALTLGETPVYLLRREFFAPVPGVTTLVHLSVPAVAIAALWFLTEDRLSRRLLPALVVSSLFVGAALRAVFLAERLALMELLVPCLVIYFLVRRSRGWKAAFLTPLLVVAGLYLLFTGTEMLRSWLTYRGEHESVWTFGAVRLANYYVQPFNTTLFLVDRDYGLATPFYFSFRWLWNSPGYGSLLLPYAELFGEPETVFRTILSDPMINPDYTVFSTPGALFLDFGWGGVAVAALLGLGMEALLRGARAGEVRWVLLYACSFVGVLEFARIFYWPEGRFFVAGGFLLGISALLAATAPGSADPGTDRSRSPPP